MADSPLGLAFLTVDGAHPVEEIEAAAAAGFDAAGLRLVAPSGVALKHEIIGNAPLIREIRHAMRQTGVALLDADALGLAATTDMDHFRRAVDTAAELGAAIVQVVVEDEDRQRALDRFGELCDAAARSNMSVSLEFMRWRKVATLQDAAAFVADARRSNATICLDCLHLSRSFGSPADIAAVPPERIGYVQLCDAPARIPPLEGLVAEARGGRLFPGDGELWLDDVMDRLPEGVPLSIETPRGVDAGRSAHERAQLAGDALRAYLARYRESRASRAADIGR